MKIIDEKGRIFGLINIIDLCILLAVVLVVGVLGMKMMGKNVGVAGPSDTKEVVVRVKCTLKYEEAYKALAKGDKLVSGTSFVGGTITDVSQEPAAYTVGTDDGRLVKTEHPFLKDIYVTFKMRGSETSPVLKLGSQEIRIGYKHTVKTQRVEIDGIIDSITFVK